MAVIGSIRKRSFLLLVVIGLAMLAFILGDIFSNRQGGPVSTAVGEVGGVEVSAQELEARTSKWTEIYQQSYRQSITPEQARQLAWQDLLNDKVMKKQIEAVGIDFTVGEFDDVRYGENIDESFKNNFKDAEGNFDAERVKSLFSQLYNDDNPATQRVSRMTWNAERERLENARLTTKYQNIISGSMFATDLDAKDAALMGNATVDITYAMKRYGSISDDEIEVTDSDLRAYFNEHKTDKDMKQTAGRDMKVITFPVTATAEDKAQIRKNITEEKSRFERAGNDSLFVIVNSDTRAFRPVSASRKDMDSTMVDMVFNNPAGTVVGPIEKGNAFFLYKVLGDDAKETATVRHLLLKSTAVNDAEVKLRADSMERAIKRGADFEEMVSKFSEDPGSKDKGGLYEEFPKGQMVAPFEDFSFNKSIGSIGTVKTDYGYHIIEVLGRDNTPQRKYVELRKNIVPSTETFDAKYQEANAFVIDHSSAEAFLAGAEEAGMVIKDAKNVRPGVNAVAGISQARSLVKWAYEPNRAIGDISTPEEVGNQFVVALVTGSREAGMPVFEDVKEKLETAVKKEKKAARIMADFGDYNSVDAAASNAGVSTATESGITYQSLSIPNAGREPEVVGTAFGMNEGDVSVPLKGLSGVYVIELVSKSLPAADAVSETDIESTTGTTRALVKSRLNTALNNAMGVENEMDRVY